MRDYQQAQAREESLTTALNSQKQDALSLNPRGSGHGSRATPRQPSDFREPVQRTKETGISGAENDNIRVIDAAEVPRHKRHQHDE